MRIFNRKKDCHKNVIKKYIEQQSQNNTDTSIIVNQLKKELKESGRLGYKEVDKIFGNESWTINSCEICEIYKNKLLIIQTPKASNGTRSEKLYICAKCLQKKIFKK